MGLHQILSLCPSSSFIIIRLVTSSAIGVERFGHAGRPSSQHLASLFNLIFDKGLYKGVVCVLQCSMCFPSPALGLSGQEKTVFCPSLRMLHAAMEPSHPPVQELIPIHSSHSFLFPFPTLWISNVIPKQLKLLEIIFLGEWVPPALSLPAVVPVVALGLPHQAPLLLLTFP